MKQVLFLVCVALATSTAPAKAAGGHPAKVQGAEAGVDRSVRSKEEFAQFLSAHPNFALHKLPSAAVENFVESLVFTPSGIGSYSYLGLSVYLTVDEIRQVLRVIGAEHTIGAIPTIGQAKSFGGRGGTVAMSDVCEDPNSPLCEAGGGKTKTDSVCAADWGAEYKCERSFGDLCPASCGK
ncbi:hypothetical protein A7A76_18905 [Lysobacter enzymogenes]|uniref:hypothetical protein n=1 Tax=Lysobacter enzymogenes TaxID=69 RepID=UPI0019D01848|nr:hypothetical protein [Lysobacter enzymogenes]MBN7136817.1 hypothetical protein [Lysobacter enzymogenes]